MGGGESSDCREVSNIFKIFSPITDLRPGVLGIFIHTVGVANQLSVMFQKEEHANYSHRLL